MTERYTLSPKQVTALRALGERAVEASVPEVAVSGLLLPTQARAALAGLENSGLVSSWFPVTGRTGEQLFVLTSEGQTVRRALAQFRDTPPVGSVVRLSRHVPILSGWFSGEQPSPYVEIIPDE